MIKDRVKNESDLRELQGRNLPDLYLQLSLAVLLVSVLLTAVDRPAC